MLAADIVMTCGIDGRLLIEVGFANNRQVPFG
jgi:hypothetical protein